MCSVIYRDKYIDIIIVYLSYVDLTIQLPASYLLNFKFNIALTLNKITLITNEHSVPVFLLRA